MTVKIMVVVVVVAVGVVVVVTATTTTTTDRSTEVMYKMEYGGRTVGTLPKSEVMDGEA
jgi:hypothetical protein